VSKGRICARKYPRELTRDLRPPAEAAAEPPPQARAAGVSKEGLSQLGWDLDRVPHSHLFLKSFLPLSFQSLGVSQRLCMSHLILGLVRCRVRATATPLRSPGLVVSCQCSGAICDAVAGVLAVLLSQDPTLLTRVLSQTFPLSGFTYVGGMFPSH
jgi:hypothetical protein